MPIRAKCHRGFLTVNNGHPVSFSPTQLPFCGGPIYPNPGGSFLAAMEGGAKKSFGSKQNLFRFAGTLLHFIKLRLQLVEETRVCEAFTGV